MNEIEYVFCDLKRPGERTNFTDKARAAAWIKKHPHQELYIRTRGTLGRRGTSIGSHTIRSVADFEAATSGPDFERLKKALLADRINWPSRCEEIRPIRPSRKKRLTKS